MGALQRGADRSGGTCTGTAATYNWSQALQRADQSTLTSQGDWRLPNLKELSSIVERACHDTSVDLGVFPSTPSNYFWSSSPHAHYPDYAWVVAFVDGHGAGTGDSGHVRLVRGGQ
ncbi:hypothetical protein CCR95_21970 [Thiocystis minor]|uniref:Lcl C-terminal domain-containing protein n=1 Tax=Thiocystis minor TaxID=61597 RepID=UPI0019119F55|nr:DUF1566 domain-containing protein [Thiocystis minor]MBK5966669.1 hypothetical protein [Thiocystis minor]